MPSTTLTDQPKRTPYAARVRFLLGEDVELEFDGPVSLITGTEHIVQLRLAPEQHLGRWASFKRYEAEIIGFHSAAAAEIAGERLALALLWAAVSKRFALQLDYSTAVPVTVFDRTASGGGLSVRAHAHAYWKSSPHLLCPLVAEVLQHGGTFDRSLLLSMELFAGARLELTERARFITMVSALEPLANQTSLPEPISLFVDRFLAELPNLDLSALEVDAANRLRQSLAGRMRDLKRESVRQAILRVIRDLLPGDSDAVALADDVYGLRSQILHEGASDPYLHDRTVNVERLMRRLYAARLGLQLATAV